VLLSGRDGKDDARDNLYLSPLQTVLEPADDIVNLVLTHHFGFSWLPISFLLFITAIVVL